MRSAVVVVEPSRRLASSLRKGCEIRERSYVFVSPFEMPSIVENARKTKVHFGGKTNGLSACVANRSWPI